jgi:hypothetical protein
LDFTKRIEEFKNNFTTVIQQGKYKTEIDSAKEVIANMNENDCNELSIYTQYLKEMFLDNSICFYDDVNSDDMLIDKLSIKV